MFSRFPHSEYLYVASIKRFQGSGRNFIRACNATPTLYDIITCRAETNIYVTLNIFEKSDVYDSPFVHVSRLLRFLCFFSGRNMRAYADCFYSRDAGCKTEEYFPNMSGWINWKLGLGQCFLFTDRLTAGRALRKTKQNRLNTILKSFSLSYFLHSLI